jgi:epsilon-lactone hydrolase
MKIPPYVMRAVVRIAVRPILRPAVPVRWQRRLLDLFCGVAVLPRDATVTQVRLGSRMTERVETRGSDRTRAVLYLHGGGYTAGSVVTHRALAGHLAAAAGAPVYVLDYRLAPEHRYPAALEDAAAAYEELLAGLPAARVAVAGDSAGGGLALALALRLRSTGRPQPAALALISPWVDLTMSNVHDDRRDPLLRVTWMRSCAARYAGEECATAEVSPLFADLIGMPPMLVHGAEDEIVLRDVECLVDRARAAGTHVRYRRLDRMWHVAHLHAGLMTAATSAVSEIGDFLRKITESSNV